MIVETNHGNSGLIKAFEAADIEYPVASSLMYSIYKMLPNDTDSTILREEGDIDGYFFAFIDDHFDYHTANDKVDNLDENTLQHQGEYLLPMLNYLADAVIRISDLAGIGAFFEIRGEGLGGIIIIVGIIVVQEEEHQVPLLLLQPFKGHLVDFFGSTFALSLFGKLVLVGVKSSGKAKTVVQDTGSHKTARMIAPFLEH